MANDYKRKKELAALRSAEEVRTGQDIGDLPKVKNRQRKNKARKSFRYFCETYFANVFCLKWSEDHLRVISRIESTVAKGGLFAVAMPRGSGKSSLCEIAVLWSALFGKTHFVCLVASNADRSRELLENIKTWIETNDILSEDFPEVCYPVRKLERIVHRQKGQRYKGNATRIEWGSDRIVLPTIPKSTASGVVISCSGLKGSDIRGQSFVRADGSVSRPDLVFIDDPQTTESAWSPSQSQRREEILAGDILGMAGPGKKIAGLMACTVIRPDDMADRILNRDTHPDWHGERTKMVYAFPTNEKLWEQYAELRADSLRNDGDGSNATEFYRQHFDAMNAGAIVAWPERYNNDEISAIQHAQNLRLRNEAAFYAEYQNEPILNQGNDAGFDPEEIFDKLNRLPRGTCPNETAFITAFVDVHDKLLYFVITAWEKNFSGSVIDYGTYPDQKTPYFTLRDARYTMAANCPGGGFEGALYAGLESLFKSIMIRDFYREDGMRLTIDKCLIDANWGQSTDVVYQFCRQSEFGQKVMPSHGKFIGASGMPFHEYTKRKGDQVGLHWRIPNTTGQRLIKHVVIDTNFWKTFVAERFATALGDSGNLTLFGKGDTVSHRLFVEHLCAEYSVRTTAGERTVDEWKQKPNAPDNHWLDCLVGASVAASICGAELSALKQAKNIRCERISFAELQRTAKNHK